MQEPLRVSRLSFLFGPEFLLRRFHLEHVRYPFLEREWDVRDRRSMLLLFAFCGGFKLAQLRHGGCRRVFALFVLLAPLGFGGVVILSHVVSCPLVGGLGRLPLIPAICSPTPLRRSIVLGRVEPGAAFTGCIDSVSCPRGARGPALLAGRSVPDTIRPMPPTSSDTC